MCMCGAGVSLAVLMDATLVRMLLMPAFMRTLGPAELVGAWISGAPASALRYLRIRGVARTCAPRKPPLRWGDTGASRFADFKLV